MCTLFPQGVQSLGRSQIPQNSCGKKPDNSYNPDLSFNALNGEIRPDLYSDEYEFDANEYQKWHLDYKFNLDAAASVSNHKCENYASKDKSFLDLSAKDLLNKSIWIFHLLNLQRKISYILRLFAFTKPDSMMMVICLYFGLTH